MLIFLCRPHRQRGIGMKTPLSIMVIPLEAMRVLERWSFSPLLLICTPQCQSMSNSSPRQCSEYEPHLHGNGKIHSIITPVHVYCCDERI